MADSQDPLAVLQKILDQRQPAANNQTSAPAAPASIDASAADASAAPENSNPGPTAAELALLQEQQAAADRLKIQNQLQKMEAELKATPQYQARLSQKQNADAELAKKRLEERSKKIFQLKHLSND